MPGTWGQGDARNLRAGRCQEGHRRCQEGHSENSCQEPEGREMPGTWGQGCQSDDSSQEPNARQALNEQVLAIVANKC
eukprot:1159827-Pelagomonas_calceolata.AAC.2